MSVVSLKPSIPDEIDGETMYANATLRDSVHCRGYIPRTTDKTIVKVCDMHSEGKKKFLREKDITVRAGEMGIGPLTYSFDVNDDYGYIFMHRLDIKLQDVLVGLDRLDRHRCDDASCDSRIDDISKLSDKFFLKLVHLEGKWHSYMIDGFKNLRRNFFKLAEETGAYHADMHGGNIMFDFGHKENESDVAAVFARPYMIDYGNIIEAPTDPNDWNAGVEAFVYGETVILHSPEEAFERSILDVVELIDSYVTDRSVAEQMFAALGVESPN